MPIYIRDKTGKTMRPYPPSATAAPLQEPNYLQTSNSCESRCRQFLATRPP